MENLDVYGVCNPLIDLLSHVPDSFLTERGLNKNSMNLIPLKSSKLSYWLWRQEKYR